MARLDKDFGTKSNETIASLKFNVENQGGTYPNDFSGVSQMKKLIRRREPADS